MSVSDKVKVILRSLRPNHLEYLHDSILKQEGMLTFEFYSYVLEIPNNGSKDVTVV